MIQLNDFSHNSDFGNERYLPILYIALFLIWPFGLFLYAIYEYERKESKIFMVLFTALVGYSMIPETKDMDLYRIMNLLPNFSNIDLSEFTRRLRVLYSNGESESVDLYRDIITFLVSRYTENGKFLMLIFGLISGIAYIKTLSLFAFDAHTDMLFKYIIIVSFSFIIGIDQIAGVRFCLAAYVFFLGSVRTILFKENWYLVIASLSIFIHFSFIPIVLLLIVYVVFRLGRYETSIYLLLLLSFILPELLKGYILEYSGFFGEAVATRTEIYNSPEFSQGYERGSHSYSAWFVRYRIDLLLYFSYLIFLVTRFNWRSLHIKGAKDIFLFSLILLSFVNFTMNIPNLGYRFQFVFLMLAVFYLYRLYVTNHQSALISNLTFALMPFSSLMVFYGLRSILYYTPLTLYYSSLPGILLDQSTRSAWTTLFK